MDGEGGLSPPDRVSLPYHHTEPSWGWRLRLRCCRSLTQLGSSRNFTSSQQNVPASLAAAAPVCLDTESVSQDLACVRDTHHCDHPRHPRHQRHHAPLSQLPGKWPHLCVECLDFIMIVVWPQVSTCGASWLFLILAVDIHLCQHQVQCVLWHKINESGKSSSILCLLYPVLKGLADIIINQLSNVYYLNAELDFMLDWLSSETTTFDTHVVLLDIFYHSL